MADAGKVASLAHLARRIDPVLYPHFNPLHIRWETLMKVTGELRGAFMAHGWKSPEQVRELQARLCRLRGRAISAEERLADPWDLEGNAAATAWKARVDAVQKWAEQEYGDASEFPTGLVFALFGSVAAELHEVTTDARS